MTRKYGNMCGGTLFTKLENVKGKKKYKDTTKETEEGTVTGDQAGARIS